MISDLSSSNSRQPNVGESCSQETKAAGVKKLAELDGGIGVLKNQAFVPMKNFAVRCTGYVADNSCSTVVRGFG